LCRIDTQYGTVKVPRSVLIQHAMFFLITRIRDELTGLWLKKQKRNNKKLSATLVYVYCDDFKVIFENAWVRTHDLRLTAYITCNGLLFRIDYEGNTSIIY
jgi:hypothetical protein